jgi:hypothetical protein
VRKGGEDGREGQGREMTQTLYAHVNKRTTTTKKAKKKKKAFGLNLFKL